MNEKRDITFTLVHGTFAKGADWVCNKDDPEMFRSRLKSELDAEYEVRFDVIEWGNDGRFGRLKDNTNARRRHGTKQLEEHLSDCADATDANRRYIVVHSHAGNIAMYVLRDSELRKKVTGLICLSSPFLIYKRAFFNRALLGLSALMILLHTTINQTAAMWAYAAVYIPVAVRILLTKNFGENEVSNNKINQQLERLKLATEEEFFDQSNRTHFLAIRPHRDEVSGLFWVTKMIGTTFRRLWQFINLVGGWVVVAFYVLLLVGIVLEQIPFAIDLGGLHDVMSWVDRNFLSPLILVATGVLLVMVIMRWSYAFDSAQWIASLDVRSEIVPWEGADKEILPTFGWVKHTRIQNQSPLTIANWIRNSHRPSSAHS